jgi:hypothetical protein
VCGSSVAGFCTLLVVDCVALGLLVVSSIGL